MSDKAARSRMCKQKQTSTNSHCPVQRVVRVRRNKFCLYYYPTSFYGNSLLYSTWSRTLIKCLIDPQIFPSFSSFYPHIASDGWHLGGGLVRRSAFDLAYSYVDTHSDVLSPLYTTGIWHRSTVYLDDEWTHASTFTGPMHRRSHALAMMHK